MSVLSVNYDLFFVEVLLHILLFDPFLQAEYHRTRGIDDFDIIFFGNDIGFGWFAMGTQKHFGVMELFELFMIDGNQPHLFQAFHFTAVVYNVSQAIECYPFCEFLFGFVDSCDHSKAKTGTFIYFYFYHNDYKCMIRKGCSHTDRMATPFL